MADETALSKRIRRHVTGRARDFFISAAPGLEKLCFDELMLLPLSMKEAQIVAGGVGFKGRVHDCWLANLHLRTANRILMRIGEFTASGFPQLEHCLRDFPWELYLPPGKIPEFGISTSHSRLYHTGAIAERFVRNITERMEKVFPCHTGNTETRPPQIFLRIIHDRFTISIDSTGEHLHKRGIRKFSGDAPLRETTASAILRLAGYKGREPLIDPMCGTGTFSFEAAMLAAHTPPGFFRNFAFMDWPCFQPGRWAHIRREAEKHIGFTDKNPLIFASDMDEKAYEYLKKNVSESPFSGLIHAEHRDFFTFSPSELTDQKGLVVLNPPYGLRLGHPEDSNQLFPVICRHLAEKYRGWKFALLVADPKLIRHISFPFRKHPLFHGGLNLTLLTGKIP